MVSPDLPPASFAAQSLLAKSSGDGLGIALGADVDDRWAAGVCLEDWDKVGQLGGERGGGEDLEGEVRSEDGSL